MPHLMWSSHLDGCGYSEDFEEELCDEQVRCRVFYLEMTEITQTLKIMFKKLAPVRKG